MDYSDIGFELNQHLEPGGKLLWAGIPKQGILKKNSDKFMIPFSLFWGGFALFWEFLAFKMDAPYFFKLWGIPFVLIGLYLIFGRFIYDAILRKNTLYGITKNRIIIKSGIFKISYKTIDIKTLSNFSIVEESDGAGTIILGSVIDINKLVSVTGLSSHGSYITPSLELISDVKKVYQLITDLQN